MSISATIASVIGIGEVLWAFISPLLAKNMTAILTTLLPIALEIVRSLNDPSMSGAAKRTKAVKQLEVEANLQGVKTAQSTLNLVVELAVQKLRAEEAKEAKA